MIKQIMHFFIIYFQYSVYTDSHVKFAIPFYKSVTIKVLNKLTFVA